MGRMVFRLEHRVKVRVRRIRRVTDDKALANRCTIILLTDHQCGRASIAESSGCSLSWIGRVIARLRKLGGRIVLHFLPPYCPDDIKIERSWLDPEKS